MLSYHVLRKENQVRFIAEKFSFAAFFFGILWLLYNKAYHSFAAALVFMVLNVVLQSFEMLPSSYASAGWLVLSLVLGFFASDILLFEAKRQGYQLEDLVLAKSKIEAELRYLDGI